MEFPLGESLMLELETEAAEMARRASGILRSHFWSRLDVKYKDEGKQDPVTPADLEVETYLREAISGRYPDHGIVGEEGPEGQDALAPDFLWILDPLDGTTNFVNGLPIYAISIGVLHRGTPVAGALFLPWPGEEEGLVLQARRGGGARLNGEPISIADAEGPEANRLSCLPASFGGLFRFRKGLRGKVGQVRVTGSIAYELALAACGVFQYVIIGGPRIWDMTAGALVVMEAGGVVVSRNRKGSGWEPLTCFGPSWDSGPPGIKEVRSWMVPLVAGSPQAVSMVVANLRPRNRLGPRVARVLRKVTGV